MRLFLSIFCAVLVSNNLAMAQTNEIVANQKNPGKKSFKDKISGFVQLSTFTDFKEFTDQEKTNFFQGQLNMAFSPSQRESISLWIPMQKNLSGDYLYELNDSRLTYSRSQIYQNNFFTFQASSTLVLPTSKQSKLNDELYTALEVSPLFIFKLNNISQGAIFRYMPRIRKNFHHFTQNRDGANLVDNSIIQFYILTLPVSDQLTFETMLIYSMARGYSGQQRDDSYQTSQELIYSINKKTSWLLGIQTGGLVIEPERGKSKTIALFDSNLSQFYTGLNWTF